MSSIGFQITGPSASSFTVVASTCGAILNSGVTCAVQVNFSPVAAGQIHGHADRSFLRERRKSGPGAS